MTTIYSIQKCTFATYYFWVAKIDVEKEGNDFFEKLKRVI